MLKSLLPLCAAIVLMMVPVVLSSAEPTTPLRVAMVFDDGPVLEQTTKMLAVLAAAKVHVTFSYVGKNVIAHPELVRAAHQAGHELANHSYTHPHLKTLDDAAVHKELADTSGALKQVTGQAPTWFWAPFLESDDRIEAQARLNQMSHFPYRQFHFISTDDWNVDATDAAAIRRRATTDIRDKTVILCHEWRAETLAELPAIIDSLKAQGGVCLTFSEMAKLAPGR